MSYEVISNNCYNENMNPVELYKKLPRKNCGECRQKSCMAFAFAVIKGEADIAECSILPLKEREEIAGTVTKFDWREDLITNLQEDIKKIRLDEVSGNLGVQYREGNLYFKCLGMDVAVSQDGEIQSSTELTPWLRMLVLFYVKNGGCKGLSGKWVLHNELKGGMMKYKAFRRECEEPLRELFDGHFERVSRILDDLTSSRPGEFATRNAWVVTVLPRLPVLLLYWPADDEFDSQVTIRFDSSADSCFDVEQLIFLVEELLKNIEASL